MRYNEHHQNCRTGYLPIPKPANARHIAEQGFLTLAQLVILYRLPANTQVDEYPPQIEN